jgi:hypothetical protein
MVRRADLTTTYSYDTDGYLAKIEQLTISDASALRRWPDRSRRASPTTR